MTDEALETWLAARTELAVVEFRHRGAYQVYRYERGTSSYAVFTEEHPDRLSAIRAAVEVLGQ